MRPNFPKRHFPRRQPSPRDDKNSTARQTPPQTDSSNPPPAPHSPASDIHPALSAGTLRETLPSAPAAENTAAHFATAPGQTPAASAKPPSGSLPETHTSREHA